MSLLVAGLTLTFGVLFWEEKYLDIQSYQGEVAIFITKVVLATYVGLIIRRFLKISTFKPQVPSKKYLDACAKFREETKYLNEGLKDEVFLVIGGTGFTGSALVEDLIQRGAKHVKIMGRSLPPKVEYPYSTKNFFPLKNVQYIRGDVTDVESLKEAMEGTTIVFQTAASYGAPNFTGLRGGEETELINLGGMKNVYNTAVESKTVKQIIYTSSCDTVFTSNGYIRATEHEPYKHLNNNTQTYADGIMAVGDHYARTKIMAEKFLLSQDGKNGIRTISIRPNGIFGPGENSAFSKAVNPAYLLGFLFFYFDTKQKTDWTSVYNLVFAHLLAYHGLKTNPTVCGGKAYFITDDEETNNAAWDIFKPAIEAAGGPVYLLLKIPTFILPHAGHIQEKLDFFTFTNFGFSMSPIISRKEAFKAITTHTHDNTKARKELNYRPLFTTKETQEHTAEEVGRRYRK
jgi:3beta-hydroxy-delta5-steroid dehydrogenase/steroid delta-isomerase